MVCFRAGPVLYERVQLEDRRPVSQRQRMPRRQLLQRHDARLSRFRQQTQQDRVQRGVRVLHGSESSPRPVRV